MVCYISVWGGKLKNNCSFIGIGKEVVPAAIKVMDAAIGKSVQAKKNDFSLQYIPLEGIVITKKNNCSINI